MKPLCIISCPIDTFSGYGARSRDFVNALIKIKGEKWNIKILPQKWGDTPWNFLSKDDPLGKLLKEWKPQPRFRVIKVDDSTKLDNYNPNPISLTPEFLKEIQSI